MYDRLPPLGVLALGIIVNRRVLPRMGEPASMGGSGAASPHEDRGATEAIEDETR